MIFLSLLLFFLYPSASLLMLKLYCSPYCSLYMFFYFCFLPLFFTYNFLIFSYVDNKILNLKLFVH